MKNIAKTINNYLRDNITGLVIYNDLFPKAETEGVVIRHDPATRKEADFIDGSALYSLNASFTARYSNAGQARDTLDQILTKLDGKKLADLEDGLQLKIKTAANVQLNGTDDKNRAIYSASINIEYTITQ